MKNIWLFLKQYWILVIIISMVVFAVSMDIKHNGFSFFHHNHGASNWGSIQYDE